MVDYIHFEVINKIQETKAVATLVLRPINKVFTYQSGQFLTFIFQNLGLSEIRRSYSFSSAPLTDDFPTITVKKVANSLVSRYLVDTIKIGEQLKSLPPSGQFILPPVSKPRSVFLIGGGSGITPLYSILKQVLSTEPQSRVILLYASRNNTTMVFREELWRLSKLYPKRLSCIFFFSQSGNYKAFYKDMPINVFQGHISNYYVEEMVTKELAFNKNDAQFFICGPKGLMLKAKMTIGFMKFAQAQIHQEVFVIEPTTKPDANNFSDALVHLKYNGQDYEFEVKAGQTILEAAQKSKVELPYNCNSGSCSTCSAQCVTGNVRMYSQHGIHDTLATKGLVLTCVGYPITQKVEINLDV